MFKDPGAAFNPGTLDYQLAGDPTNIRSSLFQKRNGRFYLALWQGVPSCHQRAGPGRDIEPPTRSLTLNLGTRFRQARVYQPSFSMQPTGSYRYIRRLTLAVPDHILVVELIR